MYCQNCGKEISDDNKFCPYCGTAFEAEESVDDVKEPIKKQGKNLVKYLKNPKILGIATAFIVLIVIFTLIGNHDADKIVQKLLAFTYAENVGDRYTFESDTWKLVYTDQKKYVEFTESTVLDCVAYIFGTYNVGNNGVFYYDLDDNDVRIYIDVNTVEGHFTIINYDLEKEEFQLMVDGERMGVTKEFEEAIDRYVLLEIMQADIKQFKLELKDYNLSTEQIEQIDYKDITRYLS